LTNLADKETEKRTLTNRGVNITYSIPSAEVGNDGKQSGIAVASGEVATISGAAGCD